MWKDRFAMTIRARGRDLFRSGNVDIVSENRVFVEAKVKSQNTNKKYAVLIEISSNGLGDMYCNCPYAMSDEKCKHMAAVCYAIENGQTKLKYNLDGAGKKSSKKLVSPFEEDKENYQYYSLPTIVKDQEFYEDYVESAKAMYERSEVKLTSVETSYMSSRIEGGQEVFLKGIYKNNVDDARVSVIMDRDEIIEYSCMAPCCYNSYRKGYYYYEDKQMCPHEIALLLAFQDYQKKNRVGDATDFAGSSLLGMFRNINVKEKVNSLENSAFFETLELEPRIINDYNRLKLGFKVGGSKKYIVKNIKAFYRNYEAMDKMSFGKNFEIDFARTKFTEASEKYLEFIKEEIIQENAHKDTLEKLSSKSWYAPDVKAENMTDSFVLYGRRIDEFFDIANGKTILYTDKKNNAREKQVTVKSGSFDVEITIDRIGHGKKFEGINVYTEMPSLISGLRDKYFFTDDAFCRLDDSQMDKLKPLWKNERDGVVEFKIGRNNLAEFYYNVYPILESVAKIEDKAIEYISDFLPKEVNFDFYLDAEDGDVTCKAVAKYEDVECNITDYLMEEKPTDFFRNELAEVDVLERIVDYFPINISNEGVMACGGDEDLIYSVIDSGVGMLMELGNVHCTDAFSKKNIRKSMKVSVGVSVKSQIMDLEIITDDISPKELLDILKSFKQKKKYHRLKNGDYVDITDESLEELAAMMDAMHISAKEFTKGKMSLPLYRALYLDKMLESCEQIYANRDKSFKSLVKNFKTISDSDFDLPDSLKKIMRHYQEYGHKWIRSLAENNFGGILADDMGLGKTLQIISVLLATYKDSDKPSLIVTPASLVYNWQAEFEKFAPEMSIVVVAGTAAERKEIISTCGNYDVVVTSYDLLKRDVAEYENLQFEYEVIDEAQFIKTHTTAAAKSVKVINASHKMALTGTPIENRLSELWSIFDYLMPGFLYGYEEFKRELENPIVKQGDETAKKRLRRMVAPFILRRLKSDVLKDLPDKMEENRYSRLENEQKLLYDGLVTELKLSLNSQKDDEFKKNKIKILAELTKIRQCCCDPSLIVDKFKGESAKRQLCMELVQTAIEGEHKILIFSQFTSMLDILAEELKAEGIDYYILTGSTSKEARIKLVNEFNENQVPVFLISLKAGGTGLNLTGADVVIHYDPWWNVAAQNQATDRAHRIGQKKVVSVYKLIAKGTIEEKIVKMQEEKANLADEILSGQTGSGFNLTKEELLELFE